METLKQVINIIVLTALVVCPVLFWMGNSYEKDRAFENQLYAENGATVLVHQSLIHGRKVMTYELIANPHNMNKPY